MKKLLPLLFLLSPSLAQAVQFGLPVACDYGKDCFIQYYVDTTGNAPSFQDPYCGTLTYDNHRGIDFRLKDYIQMDQGVDVLAAADGKVRVVRDGYIDRPTSLKPFIPGKECGNAVAINHKDGWSTQYCHLKKGSLAVSNGEKVSKGQKIGEIGLSGLSSFPHLHFMVFKNNEIIDPFTQKKIPSKCGIPGLSLWDAETDKLLRYQPGGLLNLHFTDGSAKAYTLRRNAHFRKSTIAAEKKRIYLWADVYGLKAGDKLVLSIFGPDGKLFAKKEQDFTAPTAAESITVGKRHVDVAFPKGEYKGVFTFYRQGGVYVNDEVVMTLE